MKSALLFLVSRSLINAILFRLKRLRQPKYLVGALIGGAYFYFYFYRFLFRGAGSTPGMPVLPIGELGVELAAFLLLAVLILFCWLWPGSRASLHFSEAEIAWLFPAPLSRTALIRYKLLKSQLGLLFLAFVMTLLTGRGAQGSLAWMRLAGWWIVFSTLQLHRLGASFALQRLVERGLADWKRRLAVVGSVLGLAALVFFWQRAAPHAPGFADAVGLEDWSAWLHSFLASGPAPWLLAPFRFVVQPWFAPDLASFLRTLPAALGIMVLHYIWVVRAQVSFEEASLALAQKRASFLAARRSGNLRSVRAPDSAREPLFTLRSAGFVPTAFAWKHALSAGGRRTTRLWIAGGVGLLAAAAWCANSGHWPLAQVVIAIIAVAVFAMVGLTNAHTGAQAVRRDLASIDLLKTFPVPGWKIILGQLLGPVVAGSALQWLALAVGATSLSSLPELSALHGFMLPTLALAVAVLAPPLNLAMMVIPTAATLLFPAWFKSGDHASPGLEMMGLRLLMLFGQLIVVGIALLPAGILGAATWVGAGRLGATAVAPLAGAAAAALILGLEAGAGVVWLGWLFDRFDASSEA